jgi:hypothetical protein
MESKESARMKSEATAQAAKLPPVVVPPPRSAAGASDNATADTTAGPPESYLSLIGSPSERFSPERALAEQLATLDSWARRNERDRLLVSLRFWLLKLPAFVGAAASSVLQAFGFGREVIVLGALVAMAIAIDASLSGPTQSAYHRAIQEIRNLQNSVKLKWDKVRILHPDPKDAARTEAALAILDAIQVRRNEIAKLFASPQTSPTSEAGL